MTKEIDVSVQPGLLNNYDYLKTLSAKNLKLDVNEINTIKVIKRSIDARKKPLFRLRLLVYINESPKTDKSNFNFNPVETNKILIIVGSGPAGLFAALR
ncbi:MAG: FAD-binding protein, partial [Melioribacteraceae bacterium]|nr:FAD-binding protein [Melioribacteraceae bacterium]